LIGGESQNLFKDHEIVTIVVRNKNKEIDRINATIEDLVTIDWFNTRITEKTAYLRLKSHLAKVLQ
jgi:hypothetical protein